MPAKALSKECMIDEKPIKCFGCDREEMFAVYDAELEEYFCHNCIGKVGHEPPFSLEELMALTFAKE